MAAYCLSHRDCASCVTSIEVMIACRCSVFYPLSLIAISVTSCCVGLSLRSRDYQTGTGSGMYEVVTSSKRKQQQLQQQQRASSGADDDDAAATQFCQMNCDSSSTLDRSSTRRTRVPPVPVPRVPPVPPAPVNHLDQLPPPRLPLKYQTYVDGSGGDKSRPDNVDRPALATRWRHTERHRATGGTQRTGGTRNGGYWKYWRDWKYPGNDDTRRTGCMRRNWGTWRQGLLERLEVATGHSGTSILELLEVMEASRLGASMTAVQLRDWTRRDNVDRPAAINTLPLSRSNSRLSKCHPDVASSLSSASYHPMGRVASSSRPARTTAAAAVDDDRRRLERIERCVDMCLFVLLVLICVGLAVSLVFMSF